MTKTKWVPVHEAARELECTQSAIYQCSMRAKYKGHSKYIDGILHIDLPYFRARRKNHGPKHNADERVAAARARERRHSDAKMRAHRKQSSDIDEDETGTSIPSRPEDFPDPIDQRRAWAAKMDELKYKKMIKEVILAKKVQAESFEAARLCRDSMLAIPDRVAGLVAAETNERKCFDILYDEIHRVLADLSDQISKLDYIDDYESETE